MGFAVCVCKHAAQDELHGPQVRVVNQNPKNVKHSEYFKCTVCGRQHNTAEARSKTGGTSVEHRVKAALEIVKKA